MTTIVVLMLPLLAFALGWWIAHSQAQRKIQPLLLTTQQLASGDVSARTGWSGGHGELDQLAYTLDVLATSLQERETAALRSEIDQHFLAEGGQRLASSLDYGHTLRTLTELVVSHIADWCIVHVSAGAPNVLVHHGEPGLQAVADRLMERCSAQPVVAGPRIREVMRTEEPLLIWNVTPAMLLASTDEQDARLVEELGARSAMIVPLRLDTGIIGALTAVFSAMDRRVNHHAFRLTKELARRAARALENARLHSAAREQIRVLEARLKQVNSSS